MSAVHYADPPTQANVQAAVNAAVSGDTVEVADGEETWASAVTVPDGKSILLRGAGIGGTVISKATFGPLLYCYDNSTHVTGLEFNEGQIIMEGRNWRVDRCKVTTATFQDGISVRPPYVVGSLHPIGVIDHCEMVRCRILVMGGWYDSMSWGHARWYEALGLGSSHFVFIEDNVHNLGGVANAVDANVGGRYVFRHNVVNDGWIEAHSIQGNHRATRCWEIYGNTINRVSATEWFPPFRIRGGTGVIYGNTITGDWTGHGGYNMMLDNIRSCNDVGPGLADGTCVVDGNTEPIETYQGWPARDQIGRSTDEHLWTDEDPYPAQASQPAYFWDNHIGATDLVAVIYEDCGRQVIHIQEGRDYFDNAELPGYAPYAYPHPLQGEGSATAIKNYFRNSYVPIFRR